MSKHEDALATWTEAQMLAKIDLLIAQATNYMYPAEQATAGLQLANVEVPWLLAENARLKAQLASSELLRRTA